MNAFQILNKDDNPLTMEELDMIAAAFWGNQPVHPKRYAVPIPESQCKNEYQFCLQINWFDRIGWAIANREKYCSGWADVVLYMINHIHHNFVDTSQGYQDRPVKMIEFVKTDENTLHLPDEVERQIFYTLMAVKPYIDLINHFHSLGFTPVQIKKGQ